MADLDRDHIREFANQFRVEPGQRVRLRKDYDPRATPGVKSKNADKVLAQGIELLSEYQARLAAQDTYGLLVIIQAIDAAGKDGTIRHVMSGVDPQGVQVTSFKVPSAEEMDHDFLVALREGAPRARDDRHLQPVLLRGAARGPGPPGDPGLAEAPPGPEGQRDLDAALPADQRLGVLSRRPGISGSSSCFSTSPRRSSGSDSWPGSTSPTRTGSSAPPTSASEPGGTTTRRRSATSWPVPARPRHRGT